MRGLLCDRMWDLSSGNVGNGPVNPHRPIDAIHAIERGQHMDRQQTDGGMFGGHPPYVMRSSCANVAFQAAGPLLLAPAGACLCLLMTLDRPSAGRIWLLVIFQQKGWTQE